MATLALSHFLSCTFILADLIPEVLICFLEVLRSENQRTRSTEVTGDGCWICHLIRMLDLLFQAFEQLVSNQMLNNEEGTLCRVVVDGN